MKKFAYTIKNREGVHARPAGELIKKASEFHCNVELTAKGQTVSLKGGIFSLMGLGLRDGDEMEICCHGSDEDAACTAMQELCTRLF